MCLLRLAQYLHLKEFAESWYRILGCIIKGLTTDLRLNSKNNEFDLSFIFAELHKNDRRGKDIHNPYTVGLAWKEIRQVIWMVIFVLLAYH